MTPRTCSGLCSRLTVTSALVLAALLNGSVSAEESAAAAASAARPLEARPLDLRPPNITHLFTSEQLNRILAASFRDDLEEVEVQGARERMPTATPDVWPGIAAPLWALLNPAQAWRILAPLPPDQTRGMRNVRFNATEEYVLEPAAVSPPPGQ